MVEDFEDLYEGIWIRSQFSFGLGVPDEPGGSVFDQIVVLMRALNDSDSWHAWWNATSRVPRLVFGLTFVDFANDPVGPLDKEVVSRGRKSEHFVRMHFDAARLPDRRDWQRRLACDLMRDGLERVVTKLRLSEPPSEFPALPPLDQPVWPDPRRG